MTTPQAQAPQTLDEVLDQINDTHRKRTDLNGFLEHMRDAPRLLRKLLENKTLTDSTCQGFLKRVKYSAEETALIANQALLQSTFEARNKPLGAATDEEKLSALASH